MKRFIPPFKLTTPHVVSVFIALYGIVSYISCIDPFIKAVNQKISCSPFSLFIWILLVFSICLGEMISLNLYKIAKVVLFISLSATFIAIFSVYGSFVLTSFTFIFLILAAYYIIFYEKSYSRSVVIGFALMLVSLLFIGIPLLKGTHAQFILNLNPIFVTGYGVTLFSLIFLWPKHKPVWILFILLSVITTYRALIVFPVLVLIFLYLENKEKTRARTKFSMEKKIFLILAIVLFLIFILISEYFIRASLHETWKLDMLRSAEYRAAFTFSTFDKIVSASFPFGYSFMITLFSANTGKLICEIAYSCGSTINAGMFAQFFIDMGILSFGVFLLIGKILRDLYERDFRTYAIASSLLLSSLDIGISIYSLSLLTILWIKVLEDERNS